jgi:hypothetical protein
MYGTAITTTRLRGARAGVHKQGGRSRGPAAALPRQELIEHRPVFQLNGFPAVSLLDVR